MLEPQEVGKRMSLSRRMVNKECALCGDLFRGLKVTLYCSDRCRFRAAYERKTGVTKETPTMAKRLNQVAINHKGTKVEFDVPERRVAVRLRCTHTGDINLSRNGLTIDDGDVRRRITWDKLVEVLREEGLSYAPQNRPPARASAR